MNIGVSLSRGPGPLAGLGLQTRHSFRPAISCRQIRCQNTSDNGFDLRPRVKKAAESAGLKTDVTWEDFLGDRWALL